MTNKSRKIVSFLASVELVGRSLNMPEDSEIIGVKWDIDADELRFYATSPELKEIAHGEKIPEANPIVTKTYNESGELQTSWKWNIRSE